MVLDNLDGLCDRVKEAFDTTQAGATERAWFNGRINALRLAEGRVSEEDNGESQVAQDLATVTLEGLSLDELKQAVEDARWSADNLDENSECDTILCKWFCVNNHRSCMLYMCLKHNGQHITECGVVWLTRLLWEQEIAGSNPVTPTETLETVFPHGVLLRRECDPHLVGGGSHWLR